FISIDQGATKAPNWALLGRPAFPTEKLPAIGTKGDLMLIDPSFYVIGDRMQIEIAASEHVNFLKMFWSLPISFRRAADTIQKRGARCCNHPAPAQPRLQRSQDHASPFYGRATARRLQLHQVQYHGATQGRQSPPPNRGRCRLVQAEQRHSR